MKKFIAGFTALMCIIANYTSMPVVHNFNEYALTTNAETTDSGTTTALTAGKFADKYLYKYADTSLYLHTLQQVTMKKTVEGEKIDISTWEDNGYTYGVFKVTVTDISSGKKTAVNTEYHVGLIGVPDTELNVKQLSVKVPSDVSVYVTETLKSSLKSTTTATVLGSKAFSGSYLKTVDLTGVQYIGDSAFSKCAYITEITLPESVLYVGDSAFANSGLKTLTVNCEMVNIPDSLCSGTKVTKVDFKFPQYIRAVGDSAFKGTPIDQTFFDMWDSSAESVVVNDSAFEGCKNITLLNIPDNVKGLGKSVFKDCSNLTAIKFGSGVEYADTNCFKGCIALDTIKFNQTMTSLGGGVFSDCTSLVEVKDMPNSLKDWVAVTSSTGYGFGNSMFAGCTALKSVELPIYITQIPESVFAGCTALNAVYNADNITAVGESAFKGCTSLLEVVFPKVNIIKDNAFSGCSAMKTFEVGTCREVGKSALEGCSSLKKIDLQSGEYGDYVFKNCTAAETIVIYGGMEKTPVGMFSGCEKLIRVMGDFSKVAIVSESTFANCKALTQLSLPSVVIIEDAAFSGCESLKSISDGDIKAEDFGAKSFYGCKSLTQRVNTSASTIGASAFEASGITELYIDGTVGNTIVIGAKAFTKCPNLKIAEIDAATDIKYSVGAGVFEGCTALTSAVYTGPVIADSMFSGCTVLEKVNTFGTAIEDDAFKGCSVLKSVQDMSGAPMVATSIGDSAFAGCEALVDVHANRTTVFTGSSQYTGCSTIKTAPVNTLTKGMFSGCTSLESVGCLETITDIPAECFMGCKSLTTDKLNALTVGTKAFYGSGIKGVTLEAAESIGASAFALCPELSAVNVNATTIGDSAFAGSEFIEEATICASTIGDKAFQGCASLRNLLLQETEARVLKSIGSHAFADCNVLLEAIVQGNPTISNKAFGYVNNKVVADFMLVGAVDSGVEKYAANNDITFCDITKYSEADRNQGRNTPGDVDGNGLITVVDAVKLQSWLLGRDTPGIVGPNMDLNADGSVNVFDMIKLRQKLIN